MTQLTVEIPEKLMSRLQKVKLPLQEVVVQALEQYLADSESPLNQILEKSRHSLKTEGGIKQDEFWQLVESLPTND